MKDLAFVKLGRFTLWYGNMYSRTSIGKNNYIHDLIDAFVGAFSYARSLTSFGCPYFVVFLSLGFIKM
jgi:hypothetical protein